MERIALLHEPLYHLLYRAVCSQVHVEYNYCVYKNSYRWWLTSSVFAANCRRACKQEPNRHDHTTPNNGHLVLLHAVFYCWRKRQYLSQCSGFRIIYKLQLQMRMRMLWLARGAARGGRLTRNHTRVSSELQGWWEWESCYRPCVLKAHGSYYREDRPPLEDIWCLVSTRRQGLVVKTRVNHRELERLHHPPQCHRSQRCFQKSWARKSQQILFMRTIRFTLTLWQACSTLMVVSCSYVYTYFRLCSWGHLDRWFCSPNPLKEDFSLFRTPDTDQDTSLIRIPH